MADNKGKRRSGREPREAGHLYSAVFDSAPFAMALTKMPEGVTVEVNDAFLSLFGCTREQAIGKTSVELGVTNPESQILVRSELAKRGSLRDFEITRRTKSGSPLHLSISVVPVRVGGAKHLLTTIQDITARKRAEEELREAHARLERRVLQGTSELRTSEQSLARSEERFRQMAENLEEVFWLSDARMRRMLYVSPAFEKVWGRTCEELVQHPRVWLDAVHPADRERVKAAFARRRDGGEPLRAEYRIVRPDGSVRWVSDHRSRVRDAKGRVYRIAGVAWEVTRRKETESALARANRALRAISACNEASLRATSETELYRKICRIIVTVGGYRLAWVGLVEHDAQRTVRPVAHHGDADHYLDRPAITWADDARGRGPAGTAIRTERPAILRDLRSHPGFAPWRRFVRKLGSACALGLPLGGDHGCFGALTIFASEPEAFDSDEVKLLTQLADNLAFGVVALRAQAARKRLESQVLEITEREQRRIGQDLHDSLGQRIVGARLLCSALARGLAEDQLPTAADMGQVEHELVQALRDTRQLARGLHPVQAGAESLMPALSELAESITTMFGISCLFVCPQPVPVADPTAATHLYRIAQEAASNAAKHGRPGQIRISLTRADRRVCLRIEDDGCGIPRAEDRNSGLGLDIMRYRASVIGASFAVGRRRGGGTAVTCHWKGAVPARN